ncbi:RagB/SusD family nutrient uptake outer membrane protein [Neolewinella antarctica]|uniref:RagB/SusD family nutrient uptake outer membrane protein n=1 Tax=Neolewinella antarctica TaxID=442734 RepID=A0ABX0X9L0_9BACT|nr:RagB/SusD family nutrient uptake outer membrane protein [Neolewinella antarctica]NJC25700.1 hypothetical protein [Neolewinella antarctica]
MNYSIKAFFGALLFLGLTVSCSADLEEEVFSQASPTAYFNSRGDVRTALNGMYDPIQQCCGSYSQGRSFLLNTVIDEGTMLAGNWGNYEKLIYTATSNGEPNNIWASNYLSINAANFVLENEDKIRALDGPAGTFANSALGEAAFLRAVGHFDNVRMWGAVPLRTSVAKTTAELDIPRSTEAEVYAQVLADFTFAAANLPEAPTETGRPSSWSAKAYLAKVHLTLGDFPAAVSFAQDVIDNGPYELVTPFAAVFDVTNENNAEVIFDIQYARVNLEGSRMAQLSTGNNTAFTAFGRGGWGLQIAETQLFEKYLEVDDRRATTFSSLLPHPTNGFYYYGKWRDPQGVSIDGHENNFIVYRFADVLLIHAEALNEVNGPTPQAYAAINQVRTRAGLAGLEAGGSKEQFQDAVLYERHLELALEQHRWFDLKRTGQLKASLIAAGKPWDDRYLLFPIGQQELDISSQLVQNPGY